jgi:hypothetical protein
MEPTPAESQICIPTACVLFCFFLILSYWFYIYLHVYSLFGPPSPTFVSSTSCVELLMDVIFQEAHVLPSNFQSLRMAPPSAQPSEPRTQKFTTKPT